MSLHISLDFYGTLGEPNPEYAKARNAWLASYLKEPQSVVEKVYPGAKAIFDQSAAQHGISYPPRWCWHLIVDSFGIEARSSVIDPIIEATEVFFAMHPPHVSHETRVAIHELSKAGVTFSIGSNTNFVAGSNIRVLLERYQLPFEFMLFSDELGVSKPHSRFFTELKRKAANRNIVHIGNDDKTDGEGARRAEIDYRIIDSSRQLPEVLSTLLP